MKRISFLLFLVSTAGVLISQLADSSWLYFSTKPLLIPALLCYYWSSAGRSGVVFAALALSFAGDVVLMEEQYFLVGLLFFLGAHFFYIIAFSRHRLGESTDALTGIHRVRLALPVVLAGTGLVVILYPFTGDYRLPVVIYALVITSMALSALFRFGRTSRKSFWLVFGGAVLFLVSDSLIAINKFLAPIASAGFFVLLTYAAAQFLIISGLLRHGAHEKNFGS